MSQKNYVLFFTLFFVLSVNGTIHKLHGQVQSSKTSSLDLDQKLPLDPKITVGNLDNGLKYYIRVNHKPEKRAELRLVVNAGSILEDEDQLGLAHFVEHLAFNGTKNFAKQEIVNYLESIGMRFGPDINAYTSFDETVYMLQVPTDSAEIVEKAFQILEDWARNMSFEEEEIDKERGVVIEEWRLGRGAEARMRDKQFPILFKDSRYAERLPIGKKEILESADYDIFRRFYQDWYRPELMAVVAIGDFDKSWIEKLIKKHFSHIPGTIKARERKIFPVPDHEETLFAMATDPEATGSRVSIYFKLDVEEQATIGAYRQLIIELLYNGMLNKRLNELLRKPEPPFLFGFSNKGRMVRSKEFYILGAAVRDNDMERGLEALLTEALRVKQHGFTQSELDRQIADMLRGIERAYNERDKSESGQYAAEYIRNFLIHEPIPGVEYEFELYKKLMPTIHLQEVNHLVSKWISEINRVILVNTPEKEGVMLPTEEDLLAVFDVVNKKDILAYEDLVSDLPLVKALPSPGEIAEEKEIKELEITEWLLSNGVRVVLKPTDFKNDQILFRAMSPGGHSLVSDEDFVAAVTATSLIGEGGLSDFDRIELQKKLAGKVVSVSPWINSLQEGLSGSASPKDVETMFQLIYLFFTSPRKDSTAFVSFQTRIKGFLENRHANPQTAFSDTVQVTMSQYHHRTRPWSEELLDEMDLQKSFHIYQDRFADASDFTFIFVGNFEIEKFRVLVQNYLGGLPTSSRNESWKDVGIRYPEGVIEKSVKKGLEPKSQVRIIFTGPFTWNSQNRYNIESMKSVLRIKLRESLREEKGGTYGVGISVSTWRFPYERYSITINFGCAPERVEELTNTVFEQIDSLKTDDIDYSYLSKVREMQRRKRETDLKENGFWLNILQSYYYHEKDPLIILEYDKLLESLSLEAIKNAAHKYFNLDNYVKVVLYPEGS